MRTMKVLAVAAVLLLAGCSSGKDDVSGNSQDDSSADKPTASDVQINGDASDPVNDIVVSAISDLQDWWDTEYPALYGSPYEPVTGGFYAVTPSSGDLPPCATSAQDISGNAFYCPNKDVVAWDVEGLLPSLRERFGDFVIPVVLAHEWGHAVQARAQFEGITVTREIQADCFAGAWAAHAVEDKVFDVSEADLDDALAGILELRDVPGTSADDPSAHGSGFDRVSSFQTGYDNGVEACKDYSDGSPAVIELPFTDSLDAERGGDAPYDQIINGVPYDLEDYWSKVFPELTGKPWTPLRGIEAFDPDRAPKCGDESTADYVLFYCVPDDYIGFDNVDAMPGFYRQGGDFAVATLLATQYGLAALSRAGDTSEEQIASLRADCFAGSWTASVVLRNRAESSTYTISPGDLDEAIKALLIFRAAGDADRQGAGFTRVEAYRDGVINGVDACVREQ
ncbi:neutral zinc metallopeptidase [Antrihabitans sp. YC2-6]|uniref:neutral zinc metallopeptidase n=1 Tax=Antrihabitans sp. YC2-6 TaxID=2799498 RepID=UPI0018F2E156|nr:neutral zinc metallopeptidase [Antrihabitans sp. YC2-6]MBJ8346288.1 neutral zinc metallopeptidase [Antrihabitans sp. YC2-6]